MLSFFWMFLDAPGDIWCCCNIQACVISSILKPFLNLFLKFTSNPLSHSLWLKYQYTSSTGIKTVAPYPDSKLWVQETSCFSLSVGFSLFVLCRSDLECSSISSRHKWASKGFELSYCPSCVGVECCLMLICLSLPIPSPRSPCQKSKGTACKVRIFNGTNIIYSLLPCWTIAVDPELKEYYHSGITNLL